MDKWQLGHWEWRRPPNRIRIRSVQLLFLRYFHRWPSAGEHFPVHFTFTLEDSLSEGTKHRNAHAKNSTIQSQASDLEINTKCHLNFHARRAETQIGRSRCEWIIFPFMGQQIAVHRVHNDDAVVAR